MRTVYECGDVFKTSNDTYYMIVAMDKGFKLISLLDGCGYDYGMGTEDELTSYINDEDLEYVGNAEDVVKININNNQEENYNSIFNNLYVTGITDFKFTDKDKKGIIDILENNFTSFNLYIKKIDIVIRGKKNGINGELKIKDSVLKFQQGELYEHIIDKIEKEINKISN